MPSAVHDRSASVFPFSLGVAKTFGLGGGDKGNDERVLICNFQMLAGMCSRLGMHTSSLYTGVNV